MKYKYLKNPGATLWIGAPEETPEEYIGFVYIITDLYNHKKYIGKANFWLKGSYPPLKGLKNNRHFFKESHWRQYNGSGNFEDKVIAEPERFKKEIIKCCKTVTDLKIQEATLQIKFYNEGRWDELYNEMINLRLRIR